MNPWVGARARVLDLVNESGRALGNHGDAVMYYVFRRCLDEMRIAVVGDGAESPKPDVLIIPPNGALLDIFDAPQLIANRLNDEPDVPLVIFPSSARFMSRDPTFMFGSRQSETLWILREQYSFRHLERDWGESLLRARVTLAQGHDVVATGGAHVIELLRRTSCSVSPGDALVVSRFGAEARQVATVPPKRASLRKRVLVSSFRRLPRSRSTRAVRRLVTHSRQVASNEWIVGRLPDVLRQRLRTIPMSAYSYDLSDPSLASFDDYAFGIQSAGLVITNRLHVALPAALLGKETYLVDSGYHKLRGVFEQSLAGVPNITFVEGEPAVGAQTVE